MLEPAPHPADEDETAGDTGGGDADADGPETSDRLRDIYERQADEADRTERALQREQDEAGRRQRQNVRVEVQLPMLLRLDGAEQATRTRDLSATGCGFSTRMPIALEQEGEVTVEFTGWRFTKPIVVRFVKPIIAGYKVGTQFIDMTEDERERIVKEVFDVQREQLRAKRKKPGAASDRSSG